MPRVSTRTQSQSNDESLGSWMLLSTAVQSKRTLRPLSTPCSAASPTMSQFTFSRVSGRTRFKFCFSVDFFGGGSPRPSLQNAR